jgi:uncharacterized repeat protein (TIGR01451 family)
VPHRVTITPPRLGGAARSCSARAVFSALATLLFAAPGGAAPPGTPIVNRAAVEFSAGNSLTTSYSNSVSVIVAPPPSRAALTLLRPAAGGALGAALPTQCVSGGQSLPLPPPLAADGQPFPLGDPLPLGTATAVHGGEAVFLDLVDADRNRDAAVIDSVELTVSALGGDRETIVLAETAADSGRFAGYVQTRAAAPAIGNCTLEVQRDGELAASYVDALDSSDAATAAALVDPFGVVFDSQTGQPVNGTRVRLVDAASGAAADVRGDDGVSAYPAEVVTGETVTDAGGTVYSFPPGVFRFPLVAAGDYRLVVEPPGDYRAPSTVPEDRLQTLPGAPYSLVPASFGGVVTIAGQIPQAIDVPLDAAASTLFLDKRAGLDVAAIGDFVPYTVTVRNGGDGVALTNVVVTDSLPAGMRYQPGSARLDSATPLEPEVGADGLTLTFRLPELAAQRSAALRYVAVIATGATDRTLVNRAIARADGGTVSGTASASVLLREELFTSSSLVLGRVFAGSCGTAIDAGTGVAGVRVYLEDGRYAVTDDEGKYHFEGVTPGSHVVQLDSITLPSELEPLRCEMRVRSAGNALSQFLDLRGGALGTANFVVAQRAAPTGEARLSLTTELKAERFEHSAEIAAHGVPLADAEVLVLLPDALAYVPGSTALDGAPLPDPAAQSGSLRFALGAVAADSTPRLTFATQGAGDTPGEHTVQALLRFTTALGRAERTPPIANIVERSASIVERVSYTSRTAEWKVVAATAASPAVATTGALGGDEAAEPRRALVSARPPSVSAALEPTIDVAALEPGLAIVQPSEGFAPPVPTMHVAVAHGPEQQVQLTIGGRPVGALSFDGTQLNAAKSVALSRWRGVDLVPGDNRLVATVVDAAGDEVAVLERTVRYGGGGVRAELVAEESLLVADGRTQPVIALRVFDAAGEPARRGTLGAYRVDPPYRTWWEVETLHDNPLLVQSRREPTFAVEEDGLVRILLEPTAESGAAIVRLRFNERQEQEIRAWLEPEQREWILVGLAESTAAHVDLEAALEPPDVEDGYTQDGRLAFFAKGRIKGATLLTIAFDSERDQALAESRLFGTIEPDRYYTLYGDAVEQRFEAATTRKLYLKVERRQLAALYGDFDTGLTVTELGRYSRTLTGLRADFGGERFSVNAFAADNRERYGRDELLGDGTSGPYYLSRTPLVANSDRVRLEVRDRIRSEVVVESRLLTRFIDYSVDYFTGELTFKQPVTSRDENFNPVFIIAEYETLHTDGGGTTAGGRATARISSTLEVGTTVIDEGSAAGATRLAATDLTFRPSGALEVRAELARSSSDVVGGAAAYLAELEHVTEKLDVAAYVREQETGFGVGQQLNTETGTRKIGVDLRSPLTELWTARGEAFHQTNLATSAERELVSAEARRETDDATASFGIKRVVDDLPQSGIQSSELVSLGGSLDVLRDRVTLRALTERSLGRPAESLDFPERTLLGADYHLSGVTTLFTEVEHSEGAVFDATLTRVGARSTPWSGAQLQSSVSRELGEYGPRVFANAGLTQSFKVGEAWAMDVGVDRSETLGGAGAERFNPNVPLAVGAIGGDFLATYVGAQYRADVWTITTRLERRDSALAERRSFTSGFFREPVFGRALSVTARWLDNETAEGTGRVVDARVSYAYRPSDGRFIVLERLDLVQDDRREPFASFATTRFVNNLNLHWQLSNKLELGGQIGARYAKSTIDGERYSGWSTLLGLDGRRELTRVLDVGLHGTWLDSEAGGTTEHSAGFDVGISAARNVWISVGYNFEGFRDEHFDASRYTADGPYVRFRMKLDQGTFKDLDLSRLRPGG